MGAELCGGELPVRELNEGRGAGVLLGCGDLDPKSRFIVAAEYGWY